MKFLYTNNNYKSIHHYKYSKNVKMGGETFQIA